MTDVTSSMNARGSQSSAFSSTKLSSSSSSVLVDNDENIMNNKNNNNDRDHVDTTTTTTTTALPSSATKNRKTKRKGGKTTKNNNNQQQKVVQIMEDWNQHYIIPNRISLKKETFWFTKVEIAKARKETYIMDQIRVHVKQKLLSSEPEKYNNKHKNSKELLEDRIDEISQWEPGAIADFLQQQQQDQQKGGGEEEKEKGDHHRMIIPEKKQQQQQQQKVDKEDDEDDGQQDESEEDFEEADMMAQIQFHIRQKLVIQMNNNNNGEGTFNKNLSDRVKEICSWEPTKIADFLQSPNPPSTSPSSRKKEISNFTNDDNDDDDDSDEDSSSSSDDDSSDEDPDSTTSYDSDDLSSTTTTTSDDDDDGINLPSDDNAYNWDETNEPSASETNNEEDDDRIPRYDNVSYDWKEEEGRSSAPDTTTTTTTTTVTTTPSTSSTPMDNDEDILSAFSIEKPNDDDVPKNVVVEEDSDILEAFSFIKEEEEPSTKKKKNLHSTPSVGESSLLGTQAKPVVVQEEVPFDEIMEDNIQPTTVNNKQQHQREQRNQSNDQATAPTPTLEQDDNDILGAFSLPEKTKNSMSRNPTSKSDTTDSGMKEEESKSWEEKVDAIIGDIKTSNTKSEEAFDTAVLIPTPTPVGTDTEQIRLKVMAFIGSVLAILLAIYIGKQQEGASL